ncbi:hypothetical protein RFI_39098 [Reticulomyxa filosa]|uniref:Uncharacterized protein n=1 Tax=Reticulomyxa filosa TaxID=46433 RepID=X6LA59_RETFI|nr:hypothetical protein RFI_39098 [Reticulomyxa filosa]|eukprot:ETN98403.1 hypothetical protein RFI_39098 [Reticulomyxa filosa]
MYQLLKNKLKFLSNIIATVKTMYWKFADRRCKEHHEKGRKQDRKKTKKYGAAIRKLTKGYSQKDVNKQVLLRLFGRFSTKDNLADVLFYSSDSKQEKEPKTNETSSDMKNPRSFAQSPSEHHYVNIL